MNGQRDGQRTEHRIKLVPGEWDEQLKIGGCMEDPSRQQRPETDKRRENSPRV